MAQINFRVDKDIKEIIDFISRNLGISAAELAKKATIKEISLIRVKIAFELLKTGKIGRKRAWTLSGLSSMEFLNEWTKRGAEEQLSEETRTSTQALIQNLDLSKFQRKK